jgi:hypothetical protein
LHLRRVREDGSKISTFLTLNSSWIKITYPNMQNLSQSITKYFRIKTVIVHSGVNVKSGHYWTVGEMGVYDDDKVYPDANALEEILRTGQHSLKRQGVETHIGQGYLYFLERTVSPQPGTPCEVIAISAD